MVRNRKKKSLYEVISKGKSKSDYGKTLGQLCPEKSDKDKPITADLTTQVPGRVPRWPTRPKIVQFNAGRIEVSIPYPLAIALLLGIVLLVLVVFRIGQLSNQEATNIPESRQGVVGDATAGTAQMPDAAEKVAPLPTSAEKVRPVELKGNNRIVIQTYRLIAHLEPVKQYFAENGIETEIKKIGDWYYLVTKDKYENPEKQGTDGYFAKQKIIELGAKYKAPQDYETFGSKPFHDAYGMKIDD